MSILSNARTHLSRSLRVTVALPTIVIGVAFVLGLASQTGRAQGYFRNFHNRNTELKEVQPSWITPLVGTSPLLGQFAREEFVRQKMPGGDSVWSIGNGKGLSLLLSSRVETDLAVPNYTVHGSAAGTDGVADFCVTTRYRIASGNKQHGNYSVSAVMSQSWTTGIARNGAASWTRGITLAGGKAFGRFAVLSTIGATIPANSGLATIGRPVAWNTAFEMHVTPKLWAQLESNLTFYHGGAHDGKEQAFVTPGLFLAPLRPWNDKSKSYFLVGVGMQLAATRYHASDHNLIIDTKIYF